MPQAPIALILAGGFATRLWPLTEKRAKPLLPLAGKPLIHHILNKIPDDIRIIISTNQAFQEEFRDIQKVYLERKLELFIEDSENDHTKKGALAAVSQVIEHFRIDCPMLLIAGDNYFGFQMKHFLDFYDGKTLLAGYDTKSLQAAKHFGVLTVDGRTLSSFIEKPEEPPSTLISTGCYLFAPSHLPVLQDFSRISADNLGGIFEHLLDQNEIVEVFRFEEPWVDIGSFDSYLNAHKQLMRRNIISPESQIKHCELGMAVDISENCILRDCMLDNVIIMAGSQISNSTLRDCIVDRECIIEGVDLTHKMIREGSEIRG